jgi:hypothetical protein
MRKILVCILFLVLLPAYSQDKPDCRKLNCDCKHWPFKPEGCEKCCMAMKGTLLSISKSNVVISVKNADKTFRIDSTTAVEEGLKPGDAIVVAGRKSGSANMKVTFIGAVHGKSDSPIM